MTNRVVQLDSVYVKNSLREAPFLKLRRSCWTSATSWPSLVHKNHGTRARVIKLRKSCWKHLRSHWTIFKFHLRCQIIHCLRSNPTMFSRSQILSVFPRWGPYHVGFCLHSVLSEYNVACCCFRHFSPTQRLEIGSKSFLVTSLCLIWKENLAQKSLRDFFSHLISRSWLTRRPGKPGKGEWGWQRLGQAHCLLIKSGLSGRKGWGMNGCRMQQIMPATCCET